jgi:hypothetical protein
MSRRSRRELRHLNDQDTVGMRRAERKEQEELAGKKKIETGRIKAMRVIKSQEKKSDIRPRRVARVGKPLKR